MRSIEERKNFLFSLYEEGISRSSSDWEIRSQHTVAIQNSQFADQLQELMNILEYWWLFLSISIYQVSIWTINLLFILLLFSVQPCVSCSGGIYSGSFIGKGNNWGDFPWSLYNRVQRHSTKTLKGNTRVKGTDSRCLRNIVQFSY